MCFSVYNGVAFAVSFALVALAKQGISAKLMHRVGLICAGLGLISAGLFKSPELLLVSMVGVGIGWATILSMPYALLSNAIPANQMGFYMGVFNFFIVLPQILAATLLGPVVQHLLGGNALAAVMVGGAAMFAAAVAVSWGPEEAAAG